jgi:filamentous hemagglutinin
MMLAASRGQARANSDSTTYNNSHVSAGNTVNITGGADTNVVGGNIKATQVTADVGGSLNVESLQDKAVSEASQKTTCIALNILAFPQTSRNVSQHSPTCAPKRCAFSLKFSQALPIP